MQEKSAVQQLMRKMLDDCLKALDTAMVQFDRNVKKTDEQRELFFNHIADEMKEVVKFRERVEISERLVTNQLKAFEKEFRREIDLKVAELEGMGDRLEQEIESKVRFMISKQMQQVKQ